MTSFKEVKFNHLWKRVRERSLLWSFINCQKCQIRFSRKIPLTHTQTHSHTHTHTHTFSFISLSLFLSLSLSTFLSLFLFLFLSLSLYLSLFSLSLSLPFFLFFSFSFSLSQNCTIISFSLCSHLSNLLFHIRWKSDGSEYAYFLSLDAIL